MLQAQVVVAEVLKAVALVELSPVGLQDRLVHMGPQFRDRKCAEVAILNMP